MARSARIKSNSGIYHVLLRGENKIFLGNEDREYFLGLLKKYCTNGGGGRLLGYRLSDEKIHLILSEYTEDVFKIIKPMCTSYARYFNRVHNITGKLFHGRFKSEPVENDTDLSSLTAFLYRDRLSEYDDELIYKKVKDLKTAKKRLCMEDYENMPSKELLELAEYILSDLPDFENMSAKEKIDAFMAKDEERRVRIGLLENAFKVKTSKKTPERAVKAPKKEKELNQKDKPQKKELSVWLL